MFIDLPDDEFDTAVQEIIDSLGVKEDWPDLAQFAVLRRDRVGACVESIARQMGLSIRADISYVSASDFSNGFRSSALVGTDRSGHGSDAITAQVSIPPSLPMFGSSALKNVVIPIKIGEDCWARSETFIAVLAHEMSHVLLRCLRHPRQESELHTDLVPLALGFRHVVPKGRIVVSQTGNTRQQTVFGYLTDYQLASASRRVDRVITEFRKKKADLSECSVVVKALSAGAEKWLGVFRRNLERLDRDRPRAMGRETAQRVIDCHRPDYTRDWEMTLKEARTTVTFLDARLPAMNHYTATVGAELEAARIKLDGFLPAVSGMKLAIAADARLLRRQGTVLRRVLGGLDFGSD